MIAPESHKTNLREVDEQTFDWSFVDNTVVDHHKWHQAHVPQEVLCSHNFVKGNKGPSLNHHCEENVIVEQEARNDPDTGLWNEHQEGSDTA